MELLESQRQYLEALLQLPIDEIVFHNNEVQLFSTEYSIGYIPFQIINGEYVYDFSGDVKKTLGLGWASVYFNYSSIINSLIRKKLGREDCMVATEFKLGHITISDMDRNVIANGICSYENHKWKVDILPSV